MEGPKKHSVADLRKLYKRRPDEYTDLEDHPSFSLEELSGDLFGSTGTSLCHCVSQCLTMGKGIAVEFKRRFGGVDKLRIQDGLIGGGAVLQQESGHYVYYLITKARYFHKPTMDTLRSSLHWMRQHAKEHGVFSIAMPRIGCGLDRLDWEDVRKAIVAEFEDTAITIKVYQI